MSFAHVFPEADYRHHLGIQRGDLRTFFGSTSSHDEILAERTFWLDREPENYAAALPEAGPAVAETAELLGVDDGAASSNIDALIRLGRSLEPDFVLLVPAADGAFRVVAGCVCFPSSWSFPEKLGMPLDHVHSVVPDLNSSIGPSISRFLSKIQPGAAWERSNWGISASPDRNQHPSRAIARLQSPVTAQKAWLRVEDQVLSILPKCGALLFGIRIVTTSLAELRRTDPEAVPLLERALRTMPEAMAKYKQLAHVRSELLSLLSWS